MSKNNAGQQDNKFANFMQLHRNLLDCYAEGNMQPLVYKRMDPAS